MKTAMQELIYDLKLLKEKDDVKLVNIESIISYANDKLEKEKEQIIAAVRYGQNNHIENVYEEGEFYYNEIYNSDAPFIKSSIPNGTYTSQIDTNEIRNK
jgi:transketolase